MRAHPHTYTQTNNIRARRFSGRRSFRRGSIFFSYLFPATSSKQQEGNFGSRTRKKRRRGAAEAKSPVGLKSYVHEIAEDSRENEIRGARGQSSQKRNNPFSKSRPRNREARKSRAERRKRRKKDRGRRDRKRSGKSSRQDDKRQDVARRASKYKRKTHDSPGRFPIRKLDSARSNASEDSIEKSSYVTGDGGPATTTMTMTTTTMSRVPCSRRESSDFAHVYALLIVVVVSSFAPLHRDAGI